MVKEAFTVEVVFVIWMLNNYKEDLREECPKQVGHIGNGHELVSFFKGHRDDQGALDKVDWEWKEMRLEKKKNLGGQWDVVGL